MVSKGMTLCKFCRFCYCSDEKLFGFKLEFLQFLLFRSSPTDDCVWLMSPPETFTCKLFKLIHNFPVAWFFGFFPCFAISVCIFCLLLLVFNICISYLICHGAVTTSLQCVHWFGAMHTLPWLRILLLEQINESTTKYSRYILKCLENLSILSAVLHSCCSKIVGICYGLQSELTLVLFCRCPISKPRQVLDSSSKTTGFFVKSQNDLVWPILVCLRMLLP